jgi:hypothetical protein
MYDASLLQDLIRRPLNSAVESGKMSQFCLKIVAVNFDAYIEQGHLTRTPSLSSMVLADDLLTNNDCSGN